MAGLGGAIGAAGGMMGWKGQMAREVKIERIRMAYEFLLNARTPGLCFLAPNCPTVTEQAE